MFEPDGHGGQASGGVSEDPIVEGKGLMET